MFSTPRSKDGYLTAQMERARQSGYAVGAREARLMLMAFGKQFERSKAIAWLNMTVEKVVCVCRRNAPSIARLMLGEMSYRIMFLVTISASHRS
jgi:hypothetical protein